MLKLSLDRHITPTTIPLFKQNKLPFLIMPRAPPSPLVPPPAPIEEADNGVEELLLDALLGESCGDEDILQEPMTIQEVLNSVQGLLTNKKLEYAPRTFYDLSLLKQYTSQMLKKEPYYMDRFAASKLVVRSNHIENDGNALARRIRALFRHYTTFGGIPTETRGGKRKGASYLDNEDVF